MNGVTNHGAEPVSSVHGVSNGAPGEVMNVTTFAVELNLVFATNEGP
jgi:hypothetical protein